MNEYTCSKCGSDCVVEWDESKCAGGWPTCWCDECNDYAGGFNERAADYSADRLADMVDRATDAYEERGIQ